MVRGLDTFAAYFAGDEERYALIGGVATQLVLEEAGLSARATKASVATGIGAGTKLIAIVLAGVLTACGRCGSNDDAIALAQRLPQQRLA